MKKVIADPLLMIATILIIVGFQVYWLKNNYDREKHLLDSKAGIIFRTTVFELQAKKLNLGLPGADANSDVNVYFKDDEGKTIYVRKPVKEQLAGIINVLKGKFDSIKVNYDKKDKIAVSVNNVSLIYGKDSVKGTFTQSVNGKNKVIQILYKIDSLQDSLKIVDITRAVKKSFSEEKLNIPFNINRKIADTSKAEHVIPLSTPDEDIDKMNEVTVGIAHPVSYTLDLQNTSLYLLKKILSPFLFSIFLVAVTIFSFLILYRNLNRQLRLTEIKNEFISNITHELKTPISTVSVAIEAMKNFNALQNPERTKEYLDIANNELQRLGLLVDKVLKLSMFEKQQVELKKERFDIKQLAEEVTGSMKIQFEKYHADVKLVTEGNDFSIMADRLHIPSVIYNLLDNALKYSRQNPVIEIGLSEKEGNIILNVKDNGVGIPAAYKERVFDKFFRVPSGDRHNVKGYGLGLSYVAHIVQQHEGTINVWSEEGKGTQFTIQLPKEYGKH
ncbi:MAG: HAMP domain-containing histidine kinase [Sphingobacteriales bacterium]|nr:HAMP domain-containing histidine kinase [Sphingobacteriales bacterium]MBI3720057.1 HAMP domain-containing histidine kinase [Sphingobacteriales bacterium]